MATVKILLWKHDTKPDGSQPIAIRITKNRKPRYIFTGEYIQKRDWNDIEKRVKKSHPNSTRLNNLILKKLSEAQAIVLEDETSDKNLSSKQLKSRVKKKGRQVSFFGFASGRVKDKYLKQTYSVAKSELSILFNIKEFLTLNNASPVDQVKENIKQRRKDRVSMARREDSQKVTFSDHVKKFEKDTSLYFEDINTAFLGRYMNFCSIYLDQKSRTITNQLIFIRTLFNLAISEGLVDAKYYPFAGDKHKIIIKEGHKIGLEKEDVNKIEALNLEEGTSIWDARYAWLFSFSFAGIRATDVFKMKWRDIKNDRLYYVMNKNEKPVSLKIPDRTKKILKYYEQFKASDDDYIFPYLKKANQNDPEDLYRKAKNAIDLVDKYLKRIANLCEIKEKLSIHIARHTFGNIAGDSIHPLMLQKLYRHSDLKTTIKYQSNFIHKNADSALDDVVNF